MHNRRNSLWIGLLLALLGLAFGLARRAQAAPGPVAGINCSAGCTLTAGTGTFSLPTGAVTIYGYTADGSAPTQPGGPVLVTTVGTPTTITLVNNLAAATSLSLAASDLAPDLVGAAAGGSTTYTFTPSTPGTYLYQAGLMTGGARQTAMGLYGALIVRPAGAPGQLTDAGASAFVDEAVLVFSEIDPRLSGDPDNFDLRQFRGQYFLVNGQMHPAIPAIDTSAGNGLALRLVNAGLRSRTIGLLGADMTVYVVDATALMHARHALAESVPPGGTSDALVLVSAGATTGTQYPLYDTGLAYLRNGSQAGAGGVLTTVNVASTVAPPPVGPVTSAVTVFPNPTTGNFDVTLSATFAGGSGGVQTAEYYIDVVDGTPDGTLALSGSGGFDTLTPAVLQPLALLGETHPIFVRAQDASGTWGPFSSGILDLYAAGPIITNLNLDHGGYNQDGTETNPTNGGQDVHLYGTASTGHEDPNGGVHVTAAQYEIVGQPLSGPLALNLPGTTLTGLSATLPSAGGLATLPEGIYQIRVTGQDDVGNTGLPGVTELYLDKTGPNVPDVTVSSSPNNGTVAVSPYTPAVRITATFADPNSAGVQSAIAWAELTIDGAGAAVPFVPTAGLFQGATEIGYADIPLSTVSALTEGVHTLHIRARDAAGNWGPTSTQAQLVVDKTGPSVGAITLTQVAGVRRVRITTTASDPVIPGGVDGSVARAEWFLGNDPGVGRGFAMSGVFGAPTVPVTATTGTLPNNQTLTISVRAQDAAGNWGAVTTHTVRFQGNNPIILASNFSTANFKDWSGVAGVDRLSQVTALNAPASTDGQMDAEIKGAAPSYVFDYSPYNAKAYGASFKFNPGNLAGLNGEAIDVFVGRSRTQDLFTIQVEDSGSGPEARACATLSDGTVSCTAWSHIGTGAHRLGIVWRAAADAQLVLTLDGRSLATLSGLNTAIFELYEVRLGPQGSGLKAGMTGRLSFAQFTSSALPYETYVPLIRR